MIWHAMTPLSVHYHLSGCVHDYQVPLTCFLTGSWPGLQTDHCAAPKGRTMRYMEVIMRGGGGLILLTIMLF